MRKPLVAALMGLMLLSACATVRESRINPFNWFGRSTEETLAVNDAATPQQPLDPRPLVAQVVSMKVDQMPGGAIISAVGLPPYQGYWDAELVPEPGDTAEDGTLVFDFRAVPPAVAVRSGTEPSREVTAGQFLSDQDLATVRTIIVRGQANQRSSRR